MVTTGANVLQFGAVHVFDRRTKTVVIVNDGRYPFDVAWTLPANAFVTIKPTQAVVKRGDRATFEISFTTTKEAVLEKLLATCVLGGTHKYTFAINGRGRKPLLEFSATKFDFGTCFVLPNNASTASASPELAVVAGAAATATSPVPVNALIQTLVLTNREASTPISIDILFDRKPHLMLLEGGVVGVSGGSAASTAPPSVIASSSASVLAPGESVSVPIAFVATDAKRYNEVIPIEVNGLYKVDVNVTAEGTPLRLEVMDPAQPNVSSGAAASAALQHVDFGNLKSGDKSNRTVTLINRSKKTVVFALASLDSSSRVTRPSDDPNAPLPPGTALTRTLTTAGANLSATESKSRFASRYDMQRQLADTYTFTDTCVSVYPRPGKLLTLAPKATFNVQLSFAPDRELPPFHKPIGLEVGGQLIAAPGSVSSTAAAGGAARPAGSAPSGWFFLVSGTCKGAGVRLDTDKLPFGGVIKNSSLTKKLKLDNLEDTGVRFRWAANEHSPNFTISPAQGFVPARDSVYIDVTFHPSQLNPDIRFVRHCIVDTKQQQSAQPQLSATFSATSAAAAASSSSSSGAALSLAVTLTGSCIAQPEDPSGSSELEFSTRVRKAVTRVISIHNDSSTRWSLRPVISNEYWSGDAALEVPAGATVDYKLTYRPLAQTAAREGAALAAAGKPKAGAGGKDKAAGGAGAGANGAGGAASGSTSTRARSGSSIARDGKAASSTDKKSPRASTTAGADSKLDAAAAPAVARTPSKVAGGAKDEKHVTPLKSGKGIMMSAFATCLLFVCLIG